MSGACLGCGSPHTIFARVCSRCVCRDCKPHYKPLGSNPFSRDIVYTVNRHQVHITRRRVFKYLARNCRWWKGLCTNYRRTKCVSCDYNVEYDINHYGDTCAKCTLMRRCLNCDWAFSRTMPFHMVTADSGRTFTYNHDPSQSFPIMHLPVERNPEEATLELIFKKEIVASDSMVKISADTANQICGSCKIIDMDRHYLTELRVFRKKSVHHPKCKDVSACSVRAHHKCQFNRCDRCPRVAMIGCLVCTVCAPYHSHTIEPLLWWFETQMGKIDKLASAMRLPVHTFIQIWSRLDDMRVVCAKSWPIVVAKWTLYELCWHVWALPAELRLMIFRLVM
jgi:hypothetical protein